VCCVYVVDNSAKVDEVNEITPQSNYVWIGYNGTCAWQPRYELSITHCSVDVTWFPFDEQVCHLVFVAWLLDNSSINLFTTDEALDLSHFLPSDSWRLIGIADIARLLKAHKPKITDATTVKFTKRS